MTAVFNTAKELFMKGHFDLEGDTMKMGLLDNTLAPDIDSDEYWDDVSANEVSGTGYTAGGDTLTNGAVSTDITEDRAEWTADAAQWTNSTITARYAVIYRDSGVASTSALLAYYDFGDNQSTSNGTFTVTPNSEGFVQLG